MKDNHGQTLVAFLLILPFLFVFCGFLFDVAYLGTEKRKIENVVKQMIRYEWKKETSSKETMLEFLDDNLKGIQVEHFEFNDETLSISVLKEQKSLYSVLYGKKLYTIRVSYKGYHSDNQIKIVKE